MRVSASWEFQQRGDVMHEFLLCESLRHEGGPAMRRRDARVLPMRVSESWGVQQCGDATREFCLCVSRRHGGSSKRGDVTREFCLRVSLRHGGSAEVKSKLACTCFPWDRNRRVRQHDASTF
jgi:hypothetical protein